MAAGPDLSLLIAMMYRDGDAPGAQRLAEEILQSHPRSVDARAILGQALAAQLKHDEARTQLLKALKQDPKHHQILCLLGELSMNTGRYRDAIGYFDPFPFRFELTDTFRHLNAALQLSDTGQVCIHLAAIVDSETLVETLRILANIIEDALSSVESFLSSTSSLRLRAA